jgi:hypothetical protein
VELERSGLVRGNLSDEPSSLVTKLRKEKRKKVASLVHNDKARAVEVSRRGQHLLARDTEAAACLNMLERLRRAAGGEQAKKLLDGDTVPTETSIFNTLFLSKMQKDWMITINKNY